MFGCKADKQIFMLQRHLCFLSHGVIHAATVVSITSKTVKKSVLGKY